MESIIVDQLRKIKVSEPLFDKNFAPASFAQVIIQKVRFDEWHPALRGGFEAAIVAIGVATIAIFVPWHELMEIKIANQDIILTEVSRNETKPRGSEQEVAAKEQEIFPDEGCRRRYCSDHHYHCSSGGKSNHSTDYCPYGSSCSPTNSTVVTPPPVAVVEKAEKAEPTVNDAKAGGFLYRGTLQLVNPQAVAPKLAERISALGGRKAGEVELGWTRGTGAYFHFTIPEDKYIELEAVLNDYGELKIQKRASRSHYVQGIIRLIITAEDKK